MKTPLPLHSTLKPAMNAFLAILAGLLLASASPQARAQQGSPACGNVSLSLVEKATGIQFHDPDQGKAPPPWDGAWGTSCEFSRMEPFPQGQDTRVDLAIYTEASAAVAKQTFDRLAAFSADKSKPNAGIGDASYWATGDGKEPTFNVLKGKTHFSVGMAYPVDEKRVLALAAAIAGQM